MTEHTQRKTIRLDARQNSVSPYNQYPDTGLVLSQLAIELGLHANKRELENSKKEYNESEYTEKESLQQRRVVPWVAILCNPTQMWFIIHVDTLVMNVPLFPQTAFNVNNPQTSVCTKTLNAVKKKQQAAMQYTDHSWPTYSHLIMLAHYPQCNMALHPLAHATVSNNVRLFQQSECIYSWRPLMETPAFQSSLTASGRLGESKRKKRGREIKPERRRGRGVRLLLVSAEMDCSAAP